MATTISEIERPVAEGADERVQALPLLIMLFILFFSPLIYDLTQRLAGL